MHALMQTFTFLLASVPMVPAGETFACTPTAVWDGDGPIWCAEGRCFDRGGLAMLANQVVRTGPEFPIGDHLMEADIRSCRRGPWE